MLDDDRLVSQLCALERRTSRTGKDSVNHPPGGNDDRIDASAGAIVFAAQVSHYDAVMPGYARFMAGLATGRAALEGETEEESWRRGARGIRAALSRLPLRARRRRL
jgi:hypothetical protein